MTRGAFILRIGFLITLVVSSIAVFLGKNYLMFSGWGAFFFALVTGVVSFLVFVLVASKLGY